MWLKTQGNSGGGSEEIIVENFEVATSQSITIPSGIRYVNIFIKTFAESAGNVFSNRFTVNGELIDKWDLYTRGDLSYQSSGKYMLEAKFLKVKEGDVITFDSSTLNKNWASYNIVYYS